MPSVTLPARSVVSVRGGEARSFLDRLITCGLDSVSPGRAAFGALLSPQGKILADFILHDVGSAESPAFLLDTPEACAAELTKRLALYRLRAKITVEDLSATHRVVAGWAGAARPEAAIACAPDPRLPELGWRAVVPGGTEPSAEAVGAYDAHRIAQGVPEAGGDYGFGQAFPHEALMDQLGGVDFRKGCYVGQEIVSRMQHRGTARTRVVSVTYGGAGAPPGSEVRAGERSLGRTGSAAGRSGLATIRIDRAGEALAAEDAILAGDVPVAFAKPSWVRFPYPGEVPAATP